MDEQIIKINIEIFRYIYNSIDIPQNILDKAVDIKNTYSCFNSYYDPKMIWAKKIYNINHGEDEIKLDLIIDDSPLKQNLYAPGTNSPIKSIDALKELSKDTKILFMPLAWNFFTEISKRIKAVRNEPQDKFLKYFPNVEVV